MSFKFTANIGLMFKEAGSLEKRFEAAKKAGFTAVECAFPYSSPIDQLTAARNQSGLEVTLINSYPGNLEAGDLGTACIPHRQHEFEKGIEQSITYANALHCKRMHVMAGKEPPFGDCAMEESYITNLKFAAERLLKEGITAFIEPINQQITAPRYFLHSFHKAVEYIKKVDHPNLKLQLDFYHLQLLHGNVTQILKDYLPYVGYIQLAQAPHRNEPNSPGEINFAYVFDILKEVGYTGYIGLEYNPVGDTNDGLKWMSELQLSLK
ncbi:putative hydroxypyruvate isomerase [Tubulanus polymorphus]|uniref:putative hydroxypyruvate isomerase n=1 Tax=Tubulanus polymorphus TaxID=672921 RepID=UPI003DA6AA3D